jgi:transposase-like protein
MSRYINPAKKEEVLLAVKNGQSVAKASSQFFVSAKTIYTWLRTQSDNTGTSNLELSRLRRENRELREIVGLFALEKKRAEKNTKGA